jgi:NAD(P)-dependent dehydrogenase (short-subunit alcohol dehydrogenase family)
MRLGGKIAFVSGSTRGIGRTIAELFAREGAKVALAGRSRDKGEKVAQQIRDSGGEARFIPLDVNVEESVRSALDLAAQHFGGLTTLVNNAAPTDLVNRGMKPLVEHTTEDWNRILHGTLTGAVFWACKYGIPHLIRSGGGSIINVSSGGSVRGHPGISAYSAGKAGMNSVTRSIAVEYAAHKIRCNTIIVGRVVSHSRDRGPTSMPGVLGRLGVPSDIAHAAIWLAADESEFVNGSEVTADGGQSMNGVHG